MSSEDSIVRPQTQACIGFYGAVPPNLDGKGWVQPWFRIVCPRMCGDDLTEATVHGGLNRDPLHDRKLNGVLRTPLASQRWRCGLEYWTLPITDHILTMGWSVVLVCPRMTARLVLPIADRPGGALHRGPLIN